MNKNAPFKTVSNRNKAQFEAVDNSRYFEFNKN